MFLKIICERCSNPFICNENTSSKKLCNECLMNEKREKELRKNYTLIKKRLLNN